MIKSELISLISAKQNNIPERDIALSINLLFDHLSRILAKGERIEVRGFGSFSLRHHKARNAHNPKTGEKVITKEKNSPYFKPGKELRNSINEAAKRGIIIHKGSSDIEDDD